MELEIKILIVLLVFLVIMLIVTYNSLVVAKKKVQRNKSLVDVFLKKRYDLIPNLVEACKGYSNFEKSTLENVVKLRSLFNDNPNNDNEKKLNKEFGKLIGLVENYPKLKASENYLKLQKELSNVENELQASRRIYINSITHYNNLVGMFPSSLIAKIMKYKQMKLPTFDYDEVKIKFN